MAENDLPGFVCRIIVCGLRHLPASSTLSLAEISWRFREKGVVGFDLAGPEDGFPAKKHRAAFDKVREELIHVTLHSGEAAGWKSVMHALRYCGAERLGHGCRVLESEELTRSVVDRGVCIESCVTSNIQTGAATLAEHPLRKFLDMGANVSTLPYPVLRVSHY